MSKAVERHLRITRFVQEQWQAIGGVENKVVCEVGCGDCIAPANLALNLGAKKVILIETALAVEDPRQLEVLRQMGSAEVFPPETPIFRRGTSHLDETRVQVVREWMENVDLREEADVLYSFDVGEHVEDIDGFFQACHRILKPGGRMFHKIDLSGHGFLEDPIPSLDFQTYPDWLYSLMYPKYARAVRRLAPAIRAAAERAGLVEVESFPLECADVDYAEAIQAKARRLCRQTPLESFRIVELLLTGRRL